MAKTPTPPNRYRLIAAKIFDPKYSPGIHEIPFHSDDIDNAAKELGVKPPDNPADFIYAFRHRSIVPESIIQTAPEGMMWTIRLQGKSHYAFVLINTISFVPNPNLAETKIPDATPNIVARYALSDEQALLAKLRYNRLIDIFTGVTCYSLQNHLRTSVPDVGQVETDELYVGLDRRGAHYVFPVQAKGKGEKLSVVQIEQDIALCKNKYPNLICRAISAQFMTGDLIALQEYELNSDEVRIERERHYRLVLTGNLLPIEIAEYATRSLDD